MWIIIVVLVIVMLAIFSNQKHNKEVEKEHLAQGGFRKSFPTFTNYLENFYEMNFVNDTGKTFSYSKSIKDVNGNNGTLTVGVELNMRAEPMIYSKFKSAYRGEYLGISVAGINFDSIESIDKGINISIDKIKTQGVIDYSNSKNSVMSHPTSNTFQSDWEMLIKELSQSDSAETCNVFVNNFFVPDVINLNRFIENMDILKNPWKGTIEQGYGTKSIKEIHYIPPAFNHFFIGGYPDVYLWFQENASFGRVEIQIKIEKLTDEEVKAYFNNQLKVIEFYRSLINQYKREGNKLECIVDEY
ncbi:MAG: hypothetical protein ABI723_06005 [Bacteroidia bacterium]